MHCIILTTHHSSKIDELIYFSHARVDDFKKYADSTVVRAEMIVLKVLPDSSFTMPVF